MFTRSRAYPSPKRGEISKVYGPVKVVGPSPSPRLQHPCMLRWWLSSARRAAPPTGSLVNNQLINNPHVFTFTCQHTCFHPVNTLNTCKTENASCWISIRMLFRTITEFYINDWYFLYKEDIKSFILELSLFYIICGFNLCDNDHRDLNVDTKLLLIIKLHYCKFWWIVWGHLEIFKLIWSGN